jgi:hypothetical protein
MATQVERPFDRTLRDHVAGLADGSRCFCCGRGVLRGVSAGSSRVPGDRSQPLVCSSCGSEVTDVDEPACAEPADWLVAPGLLVERSAA